MNINNKNTEEDKVAGAEMVVAYRDQFGRIEALEAQLAEKDRIIAEQKRRIAELDGTALNELMEARAQTIKGKEKAKKAEVQAREVIFREIFKGLFKMRRKLRASVKKDEIVVLFNKEFKDENGNDGYVILTFNRVSGEFIYISHYLKHTNPAGILFIDRSQVSSTPHTNYAVLAKFYSVRPYIYAAPEELRREIRENLTAFFAEKS